MERKVVFMYIMIFLLISISGCSIPFSVDTEEVEIEIPNTYGTYMEVVVNVPEDAQKDEITYNKVIVHYRIEKTGGFTTDIEGYVSLDTIADNIENSDNEKIIDEYLGINDDYCEGENESELLKSALKQSKFVVGVKNLTSGLPTDKTTVYIYFTLEGEYKL